MNITPEEREALVWISSRSSVTWFPVDGPTLAMRRTLVSKGLIAPVNPNADLIRYRVTKEGQRAISSRAKA